jgi:chemotaxis protein CheD
MKKQNDNKLPELFKRYYLNPGYLLVTKEPVIISTVLGSCISVIIFDIVKNFGGINHFIYPYAKNKYEQTTKYGNISIIALYKTMIELGAKSENMNAMVVGGAFIENNNYSKYVSYENINIAKKIINDKFNIKVIYEDTGGINGRKIFYNTRNNKIKIIKINLSQNIRQNKVY